MTKHDDGYAKAHPSAPVELKDDLVERVAREIARETSVGSRQEQRGPRVFVSIGPIVVGIHKAARAVVAKCEKWAKQECAKTCETRLMLDDDAKRLKQIEAELTDEKMLRQAQEDALNQCCVVRQTLEAEAAAMRGALEWYKERAGTISKTLQRFKTQDSGSYNTTMAILTELSLDAGGRAASATHPDAGKCILAVVEAAKSVRALIGWTIDVPNVPDQIRIHVGSMQDALIAVRELHQALAALEKP